MIFRPFILAALLILLLSAPSPIGRAETAQGVTSVTSVTPPATYLTACASETPPPTCYAVDGFIAPDVVSRTTWVLINDSGAPAAFSFYLYDETDAITLDEILQTEIILPDGVFVYPGLDPFTPISPHPLTGVFTSTASMTLQIVGPTTRCPRAPQGNITCAEIRVPSGATTYSFYNYEANPDIIWVHNLYLDGVAQPPYSDIMSGPTVKHYPTGITEGQGLRTSGVAAAPRFKALAHQYLGGPFPPRFMGWKQLFPLARR